MSPPHHATALRDALRRVMAAHRILDCEKRPCGAALTPAHAHALLELRERASAPPSIGQLAAALGLERSTCSRLCRRMSELGELVQSNHSTDGRARVVSLTQKGEALADHINRSSQAHFDVILERLDASQREHITSALDLLADVLTHPTL